MRRIPAPSGLDRVGRAHGTHLSSLRRDDLRTWEPFLEPLRNQAFDLIECGVGTGASLRTWREWFPRAQLIGIEARRLALDPPIPGCTVLHGNQSDPALLQHIIRTYRPRLVIDDGSPQADDRIATFITLFPWLEPGAHYICAGLSDLLGRESDDAERHAAGEWFAALARALAFGGEAPPGEPRAINPILRNATGVAMLRGCAIIIN